MSVGPSSAPRPSTRTAAAGGVHIVLRAADKTTVLAQSTPLPAPRGAGRTAPCVLDVPVRRGAEVHGILTVTAPRPFTDVDAALLAAIADVLAPLLVADAASDAVAAGRAVLDEEADRAQVAATLLDGVGEALVSVRYAAEMVGAGRVEPAALDEPVRAALAAVRHAHRDLRAHALEAGLRSALRELSERRAGDRPDDGMSELRLLVDADDPQLDAIPPPVAVTVQRVAEAALRGASGQAVIRAFCADQRVKLFVESAEIAYDASELNRWARRVHALGGDLRLRPDGVELSLPAGLWPQGSTAQHEGRHDDGTDL